MEPTRAIAPDQPLLSIIVVSYNTREMTLACLESVYAETKTPFELVVVDNDSSDGSAAAIAERFPKHLYPNLTLLAESTNHGFAPAHDVALPHLSAPWLLLLNPDTLVLDGALDKLLQFAERRPDAQIWGGRTVYGDRQLNPYSCWHRMTLWTVFCRTFGLTGLFPKSAFFNAEEYAGWRRDSEREVDIVTGCLFLVKRAFWDKLGGFSSTFTMYGEEADLCLRARKLGARPMITPEATIVHYGGASEPVAADRIVRILRAKAELILRHFPGSTRGLGRALFGIYPLSRQIVNALAGRLLGREKLKERAQVWAEVWKRRDEWQYGFKA
ncbi:MAG: glycosyltransferase family 2 protein [Arenibacterium sp.]